MNTKALWEHYPHDCEVSTRTWSPYVYDAEATRQFISIDPGKKNFALRIERREKTQITCLAFFKIALDTPTDKHFDHTFQQLTKILEQYDKYLPETHYVLIEKQPPLSWQISKIAQHTLTYFLLKMRNLPLLPVIWEVDTKLKNKLFPLAPEIKGRQRSTLFKKASTTKALELLKEREDIYSQEILKKNKKKDDLCDTICQIEAVVTYLT